jgi:hypothetical protein
MGDGYNFLKLKEAILSLSQASDWETGKKEWHLVDVFDADEPDTCLCGHYPIMEICTIANRITKKSADVGNCCVKRFLGFRSDLIFDAIKRIREDPEKSLNADAISFFMEKKLFTATEYAFLQNTMRKRNLSAKQLKWRTDINRRVLAAIKHKGFVGPN